MKKRRIAKAKSKKDEYVKTKKARQRKKGEGGEGQSGKPSQ